MFEYIAAHTGLYILLVSALGLIVGSFLNVIIHRLPVMLEKNWHQQCMDYLNQSTPAEETITQYNLLFPTSHCPQCYAKLYLWHNIPIISYLLLKGRCSFCQAPIPLRYLLVEIISMILSVIAALEFGPSYELLAVLVLTWFLIAISFIDIEHQILPDVLTIPLLWLGLLFNCWSFFTTTHDAILGAIFGYSFFWVIDKLFKLITRQEGIGEGDFKLLAASGAWLGWQLLPFIILCSSLLGLIIGSSLLFVKKQSRKTPIPYAPFIAITIWIGAIWGFDITRDYLQLFGITWANV